MKITIVSGSQRAASQSLKVAMYIKKLLSTSGVAAGAIDVAGNPLPLRDDEVWRGSPRWQAIWSPVALQLRAPVGLRCRRTRMGGHGSQRVQELLLLCGNQELGHVSSGCKLIQAAIEN